MVQWLDRSNLAVFVLAGGFLVLQTCGLVMVYEGLVRDKMALNREVMHEYDAKVRQRIGAEGIVKYSDADIWLAVCESSDQLCQTGCVYDDKRERVYRSRRMERQH